MCFYDQCTASFQTTRARQVHMSRVHGEVRFSNNRISHISQIISESSYVNDEQNVDNNNNDNSSVSSSSVTSNDVDINFDFGDVLPIIIQPKCLMMIGIWMFPLIIPIFLEMTYLHYSIKRFAKKIYVRFYNLIIY